jgi:hypothetical protein
MQRMRVRKDDMLGALTCSETPRGDGAGSTLHILLLLVLRNDDRQCGVGVGTHATDGRGVLLAICVKVYA